MRWRVASSSGRWARVAGGIGAVVAEHEALQDTNPLTPSHDDGPEWWTGYWALPRVAQHGGATIMLSEFHDIQDFLAETGSHAWFPKSGFDRVVERRTSAYDDANFPLLDIGHIGPKGFWLFGKVVHPAPEGSTAEPEEGYVGVFSNKRPEWLTKESDPYDHRLEEQIEKGGDDKIWKDAPDLFADKDWYVNGKNIWIVQVGSRTEFGSFETFMDRVSSARVHVDDTGDLECTYDVPRPGGGSDRLRLTNGDDAEFELNGQPLATDLFPRFENPFVRSGVVEWGQRTYCLEWNGHTLLHDFSDSAAPGAPGVTGGETGRRGDDRGAGHPPAHRRRGDGGVHGGDRHGRHRLPAVHHRAGGRRRTGRRGHAARCRVDLLRPAHQAEPGHGAPAPPSGVGWRSRRISPSSSRRRLPTSIPLPFWARCRCSVRVARRNGRRRSRSRR